MPATLVEAWQILKDGFLNSPPPLNMVPYTINYGLWKWNTIWIYCQKNFSVNLSLALVIYQQDYKKRWWLFPSLSLNKLAWDLGNWSAPTLRRFSQDFQTSPVSHEEDGPLMLLVDASVEAEAQNSGAVFVPLSKL